MVVGSTVITNEIIVDEPQHDSVETIKGEEEVYIEPDKIKYEGNTLWFWAIFGIKQFSMKIYLIYEKAGCLFAQK